MVDDPLIAIYAFIERAYVCFKIADVLILRLEEEKTNPLKNPVGRLVLAGVETLWTHLSLLEKIEKYLQDWLWGLMYLSARQGWE